MIARVRIAPVEMWCERPRSQAAEIGHMVGTEILIDTATMRKVSAGCCDGRAWIFTMPKGQLIHDTRTGKLIDEGYVCEHMLEMD